MAFHFFLIGSVWIFGDDEGCCSGEIGRVRQRDSLGFCYG